MKTILNGKHLKAGFNPVSHKLDYHVKYLGELAFQIPPSLIVESNGSFDGIEYHYFKTMSRLLNFSFEFIDYMSLGRQQPNGEWDGVIGDLVKKVNLVRFFYF